MANSSSRLLLYPTPQGLYCPVGDFFVDPQRAVDRAIITHAHSDHARRGSRSYLTSTEGYHVLKARMGDRSVIETLDYGEVTLMNGVRVSLHPAGHVLGSSQVRIEYRGEVWVVSGDYKVLADPTSQPFEAVHCHTFITESTFGLPVYRWPDPQQVMAEINQWWRENRDTGKLSVVLGYSLGKSQRILAGLDPDIGTIVCHPAVEEMNANYRLSGIHLPETLSLAECLERGLPAGALLIIPPGSDQLGAISANVEVSVAVASGWMQLSRFRQRETAHRAFVLSDHADWPGLNLAIRATQAQRILVTHGHVDPLTLWLREQGFAADPLLPAQGPSRL